MPDGYVIAIAVTTLHVLGNSRPAEAENFLVLSQAIVTTKRLPEGIVTVFVVVFISLCKVYFHF